MAGLQIRTYVNGNQEFIELYGNEDIEFDVSFAEIQDITKRNSPFTKEFKVPGSKNNNFIFNYFFDLNSTFTSWNPKRKFEADLLYNGYELYNGNIRLNSVSINKTEKIYSVTFYSSVGDMVANIGDKALCEVDTSSLNHSLYDSNVSAALFIDPSLTSTYQTIYPSFFSGYEPVRSGDVNYTLGQRGYDYTGNTYGDIRDINIYQTPLLDFSGTPGFFDYSGTPIISSYLIPSIRTRKLYELIVNQAGYNIESNFFDSDYFGRYYIPLSFNTEQPFMAQSKPYQYEWVNNSGQTGSTAFNIQVSGSVSVLSYNAIIPLETTQENMGFNPVNQAELIQLGLPSGLTPYLFALPYTNGNDIVFEMTISNEYTGSTYCANPPACGDFIGDFYIFEFLQEISGGTIFVKQAAQSQFYGFDSGPNVTNKYYYTGQTQNASNINGTGLYFMTYAFNPFFANGWKITGASFKILSSPTVLPKTIELYKEMSCEEKQITFIQNINKVFNLVVVEHPTKTKTLIIEPMIDYIGKGKTLDWTDKVDYDSIQNILPTTNYLNGSLFLANKLDKDFINSEYNKRSNQIFGQNIFNLNVDYKNQTTNLVQTLGQNTDYYLNASGDTNVAIPCYFITKESNNNGASVFEYRPFRSLPRQIFKSVPLPGGNTGQEAIFYRYDGSNQPFTNIGLIAIGAIPNVNRLTTYPFAITGFSHYTIYNNENVFTPDELIYTGLENMYDRYYRDYTEDLTSDENKVYQCKMYLTPWEVSNLFFDETIVIKNVKFRINKISGISLLNPGLCDVELVKLTRDYTPTPILFYDLIPCDGSCDIIHTHTDLVYPIWAFEGKFVDIQLDENTKARYKVIRTVYNENYTYTAPYFSVNIKPTFDYNIQYTYATYDSCSAATPNYELNVINELETPYTGDCVTMTITNNAYSQQTFTFKYCDGTDGSWTLDPLSSITLCGLYSSFQTEGFTYCPQIADCISWTPLPTPTPTNTPGLSPTPTPTITPTSATPTVTPTPTATPSADCRINATLNVTGIGWIKYRLCDGTLKYEYIPATGTYTIIDCYIVNTIDIGIPYAQVATFTITNPGNPCNQPTPTPTNTGTPTQTPTNTGTPTQTPTNTGTPAETPTPTPSVTQTSTPTQTPTQTIGTTPTPTPSVTQTNTPTNTQTPSATPTQTPTQTIGTTPTPTPTVSSTSNPICPEQITLSATTSFSGYSGTYDRLYSYTGGTFQYAHYNSFNNTWSFDTTDSSGNYGVVYGKQNGTTYYTIFTRLTTSGGTLAGYVVNELTGSYAVNQSGFGLGLSLQGNTIQGGVAYPLRGLVGSGNFAFYISYPQICPTTTPTPTPTKTPTPTPTG